MFNELATLWEKDSEPNKTVEKNKPMLDNLSTAAESLKDTIETQIN